MIVTVLASGWFVIAVVVVEWYNKSNLTEGALQVDENLQETLAIICI